MSVSPLSGLSALFLCQLQSLAGTHLTKSGSSRELRGRVSSAGWLARTSRCTFCATSTARARTRPLPSSSAGTVLDASIYDGYKF
jgi:hypothetical protein